mmetsp:Transcript_6419/g.10979  ORF Transcript_6419/g.10979 Transcript_6419/m.10979 type:complete len:328 (-) Transcript_6419:189-1172(-)
MDFDARHQACDADVLDHLVILQAVHQGALEIGDHIGGTGDQIFLFEDVHHRVARGAGGGMARVSVAVEEFGQAALAAAHDGFVDVIAAGDGAHGDRAVGECLGHRDDVRLHAIALCGEGRAETSETGDNLVEDQKNAVVVADLAQTLEVALGRWQRTGGACDWLHENGCDIAATIGLGHPLQIVGQLFAVMLGMAAGDELLGGVVGVTQHHHAGNGGVEDVAVLDHSRQRYAADVHAVVGALAADETRPGLAARVPVGHDDLHRRIDGLGAGVGEEDVVHLLGQHPADLFSQRERARVTGLEGHDVGIFRHLLGDRLGDLRVAMPGR